MGIAPKPRRPKKCDNPVCATSFVPFRMGQVVCSPACGLAIQEVNQEKARKAIVDLGRREIRAARERIKTRGDHTKEGQAAFNEWGRLRDSSLPCISCGRHHKPVNVLLSCMNDINGVLKRRDDKVCCAA
ncbi:hypothetical protein DOZ80_09085 [Pseudomonas fluorescens]|uniref:Uncharacterized protein n=1 Tax=Pseudomonas fluorescens TaxID=294 RepID=A0A327N675_PSEFL|nr:recombination protein NinG [Pseudomonas fluorescens]RAI70641.1 hypothetical protein DOZ80_09085 [Pseudomonas fluorescens]